MEAVEESCGEDCGCNIQTEEQEEEMAMCDCGNMCKVSDIEAKKAAEALKADAGADVKVLGPGCKKCTELEHNTAEAMKALNLEPVVDHVTDYAQIAAYGVMSTPGLVIKGKVVSMGKVLKSDEIAELLKAHL